jgi:aspartate kinase
MQTSNQTVAKFGGTSVANFPAMKRCAAIVAEHPHTKLIVVSAPAGVTDLLVKISQSSMTQIDILPLLADINAKIHAILALVSTEESNDIIDMLQQLQTLSLKINKQYDRALADELLSFGERFSARLFTRVLCEQGIKATYQDARQLIKTNDNFGKAQVLLPETEKQVAALVVSKPNIIVTEGFIGSTLQNATTTLGRGGSDYSAAILAEAMHANVLQIWTDVSGIYTVDPRLVAHAKPIDRISFTEAAELAQFGAKVLHPATLWPAIRQNIPVFVGSSINAQTQGTWINATHPDQQNVPLIRAISLRRHQSLLTINSLEMLHAHGFLAKIFAVLAKHELSVDLVTTSEVSVALTLNHSDKGAGELLTPAILSELQAIGNVSLSMDKDLCLIALVGNLLHVTSGISGRVFKKLADFNIRLICHGASPHNLCFLVSDGDAAAVIQTLHAEFFENPTTVC